MGRCMRPLRSFASSAHLHVAETLPVLGTQPLASPPRKFPYPNSELLPGSYVRQNWLYWAMRIVWTAAAAEHGISEEQARYVIEHCGLYDKQPARLIPPLA